MSYFDVRDKIKSHLQTEIEELSGIPFLHPSDLDSGLKSSQSPLTIWVLFNGENQSSLTEDGKKSRTVHNWLVVVVVRQSGSTNMDVSSQDSVAGNIMTKIARTLNGVRLEGQSHPLKRATPPKPIYKPSVALYPLAYQIFHDD